MNSSKIIFNKLVSEITSVYEENEAKSIVYLLLDHCLRISKTDILLDNPVSQIFDFTEIIQRIKAQEPVQYVIGETEFYGRKFKVTPDALIPRPETEELVQLTVNIYQSGCEPLTIKNLEQECFPSLIRILDIGTGTGCIAISLACELPNSQVYAYDISGNALKVAEENAERNGANVTFEQVDILNLSPSSLSPFSIIVSNPPYVMNAEKAEMERNVLEYEPHLALFVEDNNPLIFYKVIAEFAAKNLIDGGMCVVEINQAFGIETADLFRKQGFSNVEVVKDMFGKDRMVKAIK
ncbi:MAG: peptide chain release factor N(5)-glutamine methyltransferase [Bacteroidota bacterium]